MSEIDWSTFDKHPEDTCTCRCGTSFRSHAKGVMGERPHIVSRKPCPKCGRHELSRVSSDPEVMTLRGDGR